MSEPVLVTHVKNWQGSYVLPLPREVREAMGLVHRDVVCFRKCGRYWILKKFSPGELMPLTEAEARAAGDGAAD